MKKTGKKDVHFYLIFFFLFFCRAVGSWKGIVGSDWSVKAAP